MNSSSPVSFSVKQPDENKGEKPAIPSSELNSVEAVSKRLADVAAAHMQQIAGDNRNRMENYSTDNTLLNRGFFYANEYMSALNNAGQAPRMKWFKEKGHFLHGFTSSKSFVRDQDANMATGLVHNRFIIKDGCLPTQALDSLDASINFIMCGEIVQLCYFRALRDVLGDEKFNHLFAADSKTPLIIHSNARYYNPIMSLLEPVNIANGIKKGQLVHFPNMDAYRFRDINGEAQGFNTLCIDDTSQHLAFTTLGLPRDGSTIPQITDKLYEEFNREPVNMTIVTDDVARKILATYSPVHIKLNTYFKNVVLSPDDIAALKANTISANVEQHVQNMRKIAPISVESARNSFLNCGQHKDSAIQLNTERVQLLMDCKTKEKARELFYKWNRI